jgi:hypothetical protein
MRRGRAFGGNLKPDLVTTQVVPYERRALVRR